MSDQRGLTVDTGLDTDVFHGRAVIWLHKPRGGYGYILPVPARVVSYGLRPATWVQIEVTTTAGRLVIRRVDVSNLRSRQ